MSYLRFTPDEYQTLSLACHGLDLHKLSLPAFRRQLAVAVAEASPALAKKVSRLRRGVDQLLSHHFGHTPAVAVRHDLTKEEAQTLAEACVAAPFPVRFVKPFRGVLVGMLEGASPELARKVARMSGHAFERFYNKALGREWWSA